MDVNSEHLKNLLVENHKLLDAVDKHNVQYSGYYKHQSEKTLDKGFENHKQYSIKNTENKEMAHG